MVFSLSYQHIVALMHPNTIVMAPMDAQTFVSSPESFVNQMTVQTYIGDSEDAIIGKFK